MALFGVTMFPTDYAISPLALARAVEERGLDSLFFNEHTHIPTSRQTPFPGGGELPKQYWHTYDPFVAFGAAAAVTQRIRLGTGVCLVAERDPIQLAKEVASLDTISNGRVMLGIGAGWNAEEMANHGTSFHQRWHIVRERVLAMREIWTKEAAEFHGEFVNFEPLWSWPKPIQPGGPPVLLGSKAKRSFERVVEYCDGWMPLGGPGAERKLGEGLQELRALCERRGRRFESLERAVIGLGPEEDTATRLLASGFTHLIFTLPAVGPDQALPILDNYANLARKLGSKTA
jgi:probable F420-dependent oxidoreductase